MCVSLLARSPAHAALPLRMNPAGVISAPTTLSVDGSISGGTGYAFFGADDGIIRVLNADTGPAPDGTITRPEA